MQLKSGVKHVFASWKQREPQIHTAALWGPSQQNACWIIQVEQKKCLKSYSEHEIQRASAGILGVSQSQVWKDKG